MRLAISAVDQADHNIEKNWTNVHQFTSFWQVTSPCFLIFSPYPWTTPRSLWKWHPETRPGKAQRFQNEWNVCRNLAWCFFSIRTFFLWINTMFDIFRTSSNCLWYSFFVVMCSWYKATHQEQHEPASFKRLKALDGFMTRWDDFRGGSNCWSVYERQGFKGHRVSRNFGIWISDRCS